MNTTRKTLAAEVAGSIREIVAGGRVEPGAYLPTERELVKRFGVSRVTVRRALGQLVVEGLIETVPHQGYRPVRRSAGESSPGPVAYVLALAEPDQAWDPTHAQILAAFNRKLMERGRNALAVGSKGRDARETFRELKARGIWGVALDTSRDEYTRAAANCGMPCVIVDAYDELPHIDVVIQDNFNGARCATEYLLKKGHERIGWVGPVRGLAHYRERFAGARAALNDAGRDFVPELVGEAPDNVAQDDAFELVSEMLRGRGRPAALVCMWQDMALGALRALREAGLKPGKDVELVAWATEREYREVLAPEFLGGEVPAAVVWRPEEMAELALTRLEFRARHPGAPAARIDVRVELVEPQSAESVLKRGARRRGR